MSTNSNFVHTDRGGVTVIGSATIKVAPDSASIMAAAFQWDEDPKAAFAGAKEAAEKVRDFLKELGVRNFASSRVALTQQYRPGQEKISVGKMGFMARIGFNIKLNDLDRLEELMGGLIAAGANELGAITFQTSLLQETRNDARRQAFGAARERAELYCHEAGVSLGRVLAIDEMAAVPPGPKSPPSLLAAQAEQMEISVVANVVVTWEIARDGNF